MGSSPRSRSFCSCCSNAWGFRFCTTHKAIPWDNAHGPNSGWRSLYRHMYRRQSFWGDIADRQPESEQHACILQFCGIAEKLFSEEYGRLIEKQKRIVELQAQKEHTSPHCRRCPRICCRPTRSASDSLPSRWTPLANESQGR